MEKEEETETRRPKSFSIKAQEIAVRDILNNRKKKIWAL